MTNQSNESVSRVLEAPDGVFRAVVGVPGDKSLSHRALIFAAFASGISEVTGLGSGRDVASTREVLGSLGVRFDDARLYSPGIDGWSAPEASLDCGNSGTTMRLMAGALTGRGFRSTLHGDRSLSRRPMSRLVAPLTSLGGRVETSEEGTAPITVGGGNLRGANCEIEIPSAQVRSAFILAALQADGTSEISSPPGFRDHTERWLEALGRGRRASPTHFVVEPGPIPAGRYRVPGDPSSAAYLWAAAALRPGSLVTTSGISLNPGRIGFLQIIEAMGAEVEAEVTANIGGEPVGSVTVRGAELHGTEVKGALTAAALDELPLVAILAAVAEGVTVVRDAGELRVKESDRIAATVDMIAALGGGAEPTQDGFAVVGTGWLEPGVVDAHGDHRIAMAAAVAAGAVKGRVTVAGADAARVSWPGFYEELEAAWSSR